MEWNENKVQWKQKNERKRSRAVAVAVSHVRVSESRLFNHWTDKMRFKCFSLFLRRFFGNGIIISSIICNRFQCTDNTIIITKLTGFCSPHSSSPIAGFHLLKSETSTRFQKDSSDRIPRGICCWFFLHNISICVAVDRIAAGDESIMSFSYYYDLLFT